MTRKFLPGLWLFMFTTFMVGFSELMSMENTVGSWKTVLTVDLIMVMVLFLVYQFLRDHEFIVRTEHRRGALFPRLHISYYKRPRISFSRRFGSKPSFFQKLPAHLTGIFIVTCMFLILPHIKAFGQFEKTFSVSISDGPMITKALAIPSVQAAEAQNQIATTMTNYLRMYATGRVVTPTGNVVQAQRLTGTIWRVGKTSLNGTSVFYFTMMGSHKTYIARTTAGAAIADTVPGDQVSFEYLKNSTDNNFTVVSFQNQSY